MLRCHGVFAASTAVPNSKNAPIHLGGKCNLGTEDVSTAVMYSASVVVDVGADSRRANNPNFEKVVEIPGSFEDEEASTSSDSGHVVEGVGLSVNYVLCKFTEEIASHSQRPGWCGFRSLCCFCVSGHNMRGHNYVIKELNGTLGRLNSSV